MKNVKNKIKKCIPTNMIQTLESMKNALVWLGKHIGLGIFCIIYLSVAIVCVTANNIRKLLSNRAKNAKDKATKIVDDAIDI